MGGKKTMGVVHAEAFEFFKRNYKPLWLISLAMLVVEFVLGIVASVFTVPLNIISSFMSASGESFYRGEGLDNMMRALVPLLGVFSVIWLLVMAVGIVVSILERASHVAAYEGTLQLLDGGNPTFDGLWKSFAKNWKRFVGVVAWSMLWEFLWGLLFIVPGIVKGYSYRLAPYLILQYPDMTVRQALRKSMQMTDGYKGRLFGIDLIYFLYSLTAVVGLCVLFVGAYAAQVLLIFPMMFSMYSIVYLDIREAAIERDILPREPLNATTENN